MLRSIISDLNKSINTENILRPKNQLSLPGPVLGYDMVAPWLLVERVICIGINKTLKKEIAIGTSYEGEIIEVCEKKAEEFVEEQGKEKNADEEVITPEVCPADKILTDEVFKLILASEDEREQLKLIQRFEARARELDRQLKTRDVHYVRDFKNSLKIWRHHEERTTVPIRAQGNYTAVDYYGNGTEFYSGKTFTIDPIEEGGVEFYEGNTKLTANASTGMYTLKNRAAFRLVYDKSEGILKLTDYQQSQGKGATVKVHLMFPGQTKAIVKSFSIKTK